MERAGVLSYKVLIFERHWDGAFKPPHEYDRQALVCLSTHDLPTLRGWWLGRDIEARAALGQHMSEEARQAQHAGRGQDRQRLVEALGREALFAEAPEPFAAMPDELALSVHRYLARSPSMVMMVQMEDALGAVDQVNLPGTDAGHPNWQRKLPLDIERWADSARVQDLFGMLRAERGG
jgi:4-alpha-glucanotransferase